MITTRQTGYTLIEIMISVAILAIIAAIAIPAYRGYVVEGRYGAANQDMQQMQLLLADLATDNDLQGVEPASYAGGSELNVYNVATGIAVASTLPSGGAAWLDPWNAAYRYERLVGFVNPQVFQLRSAGPDGSYGNADDACIRSDGQDCT